MHIAKRVRDLTPALIDEIKLRSTELRQAGKDIINLGQAIPNFPPVPAAVAAARQALDEPDTHTYSPDAGILSLRQALSNTLAAQNGIQADPENELLITTGANQAFLTALITLLETGDRVLLPAPAFFNHDMAVRIAGGISIEVPLDREIGFQLRFQDLEPYLEPKPRALVIVSPNNPTGAVYDPAELQKITMEMVDRGIAILTDETYQHFVYEGAQHYSPAALPGTGSTVITIGSFSKAYSLTGWRIGFLAAPAPFVQQALKVQDTMVICAAVITQKAALGALQEPAQTLAQRRDILDKRRCYLAEHLSTLPGLNWQPTRGGFFAFVHIPGCSDSFQLAMDLLDQTHIVTIPGSLFGRHGEGYLRISYGSVDLPELVEACSRLARFFSSR